MSEQLALDLAGDGAEPPAPSELADREARELIASAIDQTLFVEAGAGSGKTSALVERVLSLVRSGIPMEAIAAITFTEKAAAELRQRIRERLDAELRTSPDPALAEAIHQLDGAAICTLHAFAQRLLFEHPIEAGLPPGVEVLDELASQLYLDQRWELFLPALIADDTMAAPLLIGDALRIGPPVLRAMAEQFEQNWDLLQARLPAHAEPVSIDLAPAIEAMRHLATAADEALDASDALAIRCLEVGEYAQRLAALAGASPRDVDDLVDLAELLQASQPAFGTDGRPYRRLGARSRWPSAERHEQIKDELFAAGELRDGVLDDLRNHVIHSLAGAVGRFVLDGVAERRRQGRLRFHDLLVLARDLLTNPEHGPHVRASLAERYRCLLIDEFQDTDPIQVHLAALLADPAAPPDDWARAEPRGGRLFFVGDPKQSIYRFRRADIGTYLRAQRVFGDGSGQVKLTSNFRSTAPVIDWVNQVFAELIMERDGSSPAYTALRASRPPPPVGPGVAAFGVDAHPGALRAHALRQAEATDVVASIQTALADEWQVGDTTSPDGGGWRSARLGDITILLPARTSLPALEQALEHAGIPYRAETQSLVYATPEVRDLLMVARAIDDPTDDLAIVTALRTPALACGDDDLHRFAQRHGARWNHQTTDEDRDPDDPVVAGLTWLGELHRQKPWLPPANLLDRIVRERRLMELGVCQQRHREVWRRLRFVIDQARAFADATGGDLRDYLGWVRLQASDSARVAEAILPETDTDAVRIMTVHASKGLEFPIAIVSGLTTKVQNRVAPVEVVWPPDGTIGYRLGRGNTTPEYDNYQPLDEQMDADERRRLLYVACTRARDHLVVSLHRCADGPDNTFAAILVSAGALDRASPLRPVSSTETPTAAPSNVTPLPARATWERELARAKAGAERSGTVSATAVAALGGHDQPDPGLGKGARDIDLPPWQKGRYGTAVGRAVHAVLQTVDLRTGDDVEQVARAQAAAEGIIGQEATIASLARAAIASPVVAEAAQRPHWREVFVASPVAGRLLEGYIDLLYDRGDGLVVVDHKTDAWTDQHSLDDKVARYRIQLAAYAVALEATTGRDVVDAVLLFLDPGGAEARPVPDLDRAKDEVRSLVPQVVAGGEETMGHDTGVPGLGTPY